MQGWGWCGADGRGNGAKVHDAGWDERQLLYASSFGVQAARLHCCWRCWSCWRCWRCQGPALVPSVPPPFPCCRRLEGRNADLFRENFKDTPWVKVPKVLWDYSSSEVLVLEYVPGGWRWRDPRKAKVHPAMARLAPLPGLDARQAPQAPAQGPAQSAAAASPCCPPPLPPPSPPGKKINDAKAIDEMGLDRTRLARLAVESYLQQILRYGFFHAGGWLLLCEGRSCVCGSALLSRRQRLRALGTWLASGVRGVHQPGAAPRCPRPLGPCPPLSCHPPFMPPTPPRPTPHAHVRAPHPTRRPPPGQRGGRQRWAPPRTPRLPAPAARLAAARGPSCPSCRCRCRRRCCRRCCCVRCRCRRGGRPHHLLRLRHDGHHRWRRARRPAGAVLRRVQQGRREVGARLWPRAPAHDCTRARRPAASCAHGPLFAAAAHAPTPLPPRAGAWRR
jgi:hypothetical protein